MIKVNISKAKDIAHAKRRDKRAAELAPLDIESTIPVKAREAEAKRQVIRDKHAVFQTRIDGTTTVDELKTIVAEIG